MGIVPNKSQQSWKPLNLCPALCMLMQTAIILNAHQWRTEGGFVVFKPAPLRNSEGPPKLCQTQPDLWKLLKTMDLYVCTFSGERLAAPCQPLEQDWLTTSYGVSTTLSTSSVFNAGIPLCYITKFRVKSNRVFFPVGTAIFFVP